MHLKATSIKDALDEWEKKNKIQLSEAKQVELQFRWPPIAKMDNNLSVLIKCEYVKYNTRIYLCIYNYSLQLLFEIVSMK